MTNPFPEDMADDVREQLREDLQTHGRARFVKAWDGYRRLEVGE